MLPPPPSDLNPWHPNAEWVTIRRNSDGATVQFALGLFRRTAQTFYWDTAAGKAAASSSSGGGTGAAQAHAQAQQHKRSSARAKANNAASEATGVAAIAAAAAAVQASARPVIIPVRSFASNTLRCSMLLRRGDDSAAAMAVAAAAAAAAGATNAVDAAGNAAGQQHQQQHQPQQQAQGQQDEEQQQQQDEEQQPQQQPQQQQPRQQGDVWVPITSTSITEYVRGHRQGGLEGHSIGGWSEGVTASNMPLCIYACASPA